MAAASGAVVAYRDLDGGRQEYRVRLKLDRPTTPQAIDVRRLDDRVGVVIQAATLYDERTRMFSALLPSDRGPFRLAHSGDVKIYENLDLQPRAHLVASTLPASNRGSGGAAYARPRLEADRRGGRRRCVAVNVVPNRPG